MVKYSDRLNIAMNLINIYYTQKLLFSLRSLSNGKFQYNILLFGILVLKYTLCKYKMIKKSFQRTINIADFENIMILGVCTGHKHFKLHFLFKFTLTDYPKLSKNG